jgi:hypothetical protein
MTRGAVLAILLVLAWRNDVLGQNFIAPMNLEDTAVRIDTFCKRNAPLVAPTYMQAFQAWKERLGSYAAKYQDYLVRKSFEGEQPSDGKIRAAQEGLNKSLDDYLSKLEANPTDAEAYCRLNVAGLSEKHDGDLRRLVDDDAAEREQRAR